MKIVLIIIVITVILGTAIWGLKATSEKKTSVISIGNKISYNLDIVSNPIDQAKGLSGRKVLEQDKGMLFVFNYPKKQNFWMKDMHFAIDVIWINDYKVIGISENILPPLKTGGIKERMSSPSAADMVLEINAGEVEAHGIKVGDSINISINSDVKN